jgi:hypothetical protein
MKLATVSALFALGVAAAFGTGISSSDPMVQLAVTVTAAALASTIAVRVATRKTGVHNWRADTGTRIRPGVAVGDGHQPDYSNVL